MKKYTHINKKERKILHQLYSRGLSARKIAEKLNRHHSTISRELKRNTQDDEFGYYPDTADRLAKQRHNGRYRKLDKFPLTKLYIMLSLMLKCSPEIIAGRMKFLRFPILVCTETIYQWIYSNEGNRLGLYKYLLKGRPKRQVKFGRKYRAQTIPERISIHERPESINKRENFGHFEGDLTFCKSASENIGVLIERKSRAVILVKNVSKETTEVICGMFNALAQLPENLRKSVTLDNGGEFVGHTLFKKHLGMKTYFCDPGSPSQKGQVEQVNSMIHRYIGKKENLKNYSTEDILEVQRQLNNMPRKCLGFKTPVEVLCGM
ncbi:MAG: IS30 family transposase [Ignavibacteriaceae bacterium]|nr:IS30 family transposase [Ignavibacteriaceae bacterium]